MNKIATTGFGKKHAKYNSDYHYQK